MLIDAHAHVDKYGDDLAAALAEIRERRIFTIATAMDPPSYRELHSIAERCGFVLPTFGVHPKRAPEYSNRLNELGAAIDSSRAIGEIGLDFHWVKDSSAFPAQLKVLDYFLAAAREQNKFVNLHTKGGEKKILDLLEHYDVKRAIIHWYSGPLDVLHAMVQFGAYFTVGVEVLYSETIQTIAKQIPDHLLLTETDNPGAMKWLKGVAGRPKDLEKVIASVAGLRSTSPGSIRCLVHENFLHLIEGDPWLQETRTMLALARS